MLQVGWPGYSNSQPVGETPCRLELIEDLAHRPAPLIGRGSPMLVTPQLRVTEGESGREVPG